MAPFFVEFTGLPGAGKTTIAKAVVSELARMDYRCFGNGSLGNQESITSKESKRLFSRLETFYNVISSCITHKCVAANAMMFALQTRPLNLVSFLRAAKLLHRLNFIKSMMAEKYDLVIFDQGVIQYIWSITATSSNPLSEQYMIRLLKSVLDEISVTIVLVEIDADVAISRINNRRTMTSRFDNMPSKKAERSLIKQSDFFKQVINWCVELKDTRYLAIDGNHPINRNSETIVHFIEETWQPRRG